MRGGLFPLYCGRCGLQLYRVGIHNAELRMGLFFLLAALAIPENRHRKGSDITVPARAEQHPVDLEPVGTPAYGGTL